MKLSNTKPFKRSIAVLTMMFLLSDTVLWGMPVEDVAVPNNTLQVQSQMFAPIIHLPGWEKDAQVEAEMNAIVVLVMKDSKRAARDINSSIDRWCGAKSKERVLTLLEDARTNASGETVIDIGFLEPKEGDMPFRLTINASSFEALISEPRKKVKMTRLNVSAKKTRDFYGRTAEYDASGRITKVYDEKTGIVWEEYSYGKDPEDIAVRLYNPSIGKHIRCVYSFKRNNFVRWKIEIENSSGIFNEEGNFLVGEGDAFIEQLDINVSLGNSGIGTTVKQWLALRADREGKSILFSETMNPISARINAKLYDLSTLRLTQGDIVREIKVSNEKELMTAVTAQEYEIVKNDNFIGFITVTESGEIVDNDEAFKGYDLSLRNGILNAVDPKGDPVEVNYRHPFYWFGMADAEKIIAAQNRSDEERKKRTISGIAERITGRTTEYDASGRITKVYDENTGIVWEEYSYGEDPEDIAVKLYNPSIGKHIRCVYSFKIYNSLLKWKIEIENDPGIFNEKGYFLIGEGDAFIELLDIDVSPRNSGIGTTVMQWLALKADREGKEIGVSKTMNPVTSKIIAKFYDLSTLCLTQRDIGRVIKVSNEKELMTAVTAQEYEIVKNENFIGFITVTESGEIVDKDEALEGYDLSLRNGILNAVDPEGDPVEVNYKYPLYWFGMADAEKIIAAQNRSEEKRKERTGPEKAQGPVKDSADPVTYADFILKIAELSGNGLLEKTEGKDVIGGLVYDVITGGQVSADNEKEREAFAKTVFLPRDKGMQEKSVHLFEQDGIDAENIRYFLKEKDIAFQNKALNGFEAEENKMIEKAVYAVEAVLIRALFGIFVENDKMIEIYEPREGEQKGHWEKIKELIHKGLLTAGRDGRIYELVAPIVNRLNGMSDNDVIAKGEEEILHPLNERYVENFHLNIEDLDETFEAYVNRKVPAGYNYIITQSISTHINSLGMVNPDNPKTVERNLGYFEIAFILVKAIDIIASRKRDTAHRFLEEVKNAKARGGLIGKDAEGAFSALAYEILTGKSGPETGMNAAKEIMSGADEGSALRKNIREFCGGNTADTGSMRDFLDGKKAILRYLDANGFSGSEKDAVSRIIHRSETVFIYAPFDIFLDNDTLKNMFAPNNDEVYWGQVKGTLHSELLGIGMNRRVYDIIGPAVRKINGMAFTDMAEKIEKEIITPNNERYEREAGLGKAGLAVTFEDFLSRQITIGNNYSMRQIVADRSACLSLVDPDRPEDIEEDLGYFEGIFIILKAIEEFDRLREEKEKAIACLPRLNREKTITDGPDREMFNVFAGEVLGLGKKFSEDVSAQELFNEIIFEDEDNGLRDKMRKFLEGNDIDDEKIGVFLAGKDALIKDIMKSPDAGEGFEIIKQFFYRVEMLLILSRFDLFTENDLIVKIYGGKRERTMWKRARKILHDGFLSVCSDKNRYALVKPLIEKINTMNDEDIIGTTENDVLARFNLKYKGITRGGAREPEIKTRFEKFVDVPMPSRIDGDYCPRQFLSDNIYCLHLINADDPEGFRKDGVLVENLLLTLRAIQIIDGRRRKGSDDTEEAKQLRRTHQRISEIHVAARGIIEGKGKIKELLSAAEIPGKRIPINIVVDIETILTMDATDVETNIRTLANLVLSYADIDNANFIFKKGLYGARIGKDRTPSSIVTENVETLRKIIREEALHYGVSGEALDRLTRERVMEMSEYPEDDRVMPVEIPIVSETWLRQAKARDVRLKINQYPVALKGSIADSEGVAMRNFETAFAIAFTKSALVLAKRNDEEKGPREESGFEELKEKLLPEINDLYKAAFGMDMKISEKTLDNMVYTEGEDLGSETRMNLAIDLALPPIMRGTVEILRGMHEKVQGLIRFA